MGVIKTTNVTDARAFFHGELQQLLAKQSIAISPNTLEYLVNLMLRYMESDQFFSKDENGKLRDNVLAEHYAEYLNGGTEKQKLILQRLGDICLLISGFFADSLNRKLVDVDYYLGMGGSAYWTLSHMHLKNISVTYQELSQNIKPFSGVLSEMSERSGLQNNSDILRLYERWLLTGNDRLKALLNEHGIHPNTLVDPKVKH